MTLITILLDEERYRSHHLCKHFSSQWHKTPQLHLTLPTSYKPSNGNHKDSLDHVYIRNKRPPNQKRSI